jgi:hypothetical protein
VREQRLAKIREQIREEMVEKMRKDRSSEAVSKAKEEAEAKAKCFLLCFLQPSAISTCACAFRSVDYEHVSHSHGIAYWQQMYIQLLHLIVEPLNCSFDAQSLNCTVIVEVELHLLPGPVGAETRQLSTTEWSHLLELWGRVSSSLCNV